MNIELYLPPLLQDLAGGAKQVSVSGRTVGECLEAVVALYPDLQGRLYTAAGKVARGLNVFVNGKSVYPGELEEPVHDGDRIHLTYVMVGG